MVNNQKDHKINNIDLPAPEDKTIFFDNDNLYACLASFPIVKGHSLVVWKKKVSDLHLLSRSEYEYLMDTVDQVRDVLMKVYHTDKVYLVYMDEVKHVHWHLLPRTGGENGFTMLEHKPKKLTDFSDRDKIIKTLKDL